MANKEVHCTSVASHFSFPLPMGRTHQARSRHASVVSGTESGLYRLLDLTCNGQHSAVCCRKGVDTGCPPAPACPCVGNSPCAFGWEPTPCPLCWAGALGSLGTNGCASAAACMSTMKSTLFSTALPCASAGPVPCFVWPWQAHHAALHVAGRPCGSSALHHGLF